MAIQELVNRSRQSALGERPGAAEAAERTEDADRGDGEHEGALGHGLIAIAVQEQIPLDGQVVRWASPRGTRLARAANTALNEERLAQTSPAPLRRMSVRRRPDGISSFAPALVG
jgi:hypothetical protein